MNIKINVNIPILQCIFQTNFFFNLICYFCITTFNVDNWYLAITCYFISVFSFELNLSVQQTGFTVYRKYKPRPDDENKVRVCQ